MERSHGAVTAGFPTPSPFLLETSGRGQTIGGHADGPETLMIPRTSRVTGGCVSRSGMEHVFAKAARSSKSRRLAESCSHFAPIPPRNMPKRGQGPRNSKERETPCRYLSFPRDQRVTGHGRLVLITQRSSVQIRPPQPLPSPRDHDGLGGLVCLRLSAHGVRFSVFFPWSGSKGVEGRVVPNVLCGFREGCGKITDQRTGGIDGACTLRPR